MPEAGGGYGQPQGEGSRGRWRRDRSIYLDIEGIKIGAEGALVSLTDLWKKEGSDPNKRPGEWRRQDTAQAFIQAEETCTLGPGLVETREGRNGGTRAYRQIVIEYAKNLRPELAVLVNQVFAARCGEGDAGDGATVARDQLRRTDVGG